MRVCLMQRVRTSCPGSLQALCVAAAACVGRHAPRFLLADNCALLLPPSPDRGVRLFLLCLQVHNPTTQPQEVQLTVQEAQGFVFAGSKQQVVNVVPRTTHNITWTLVAHASGQLQLPTVRVGCSKLSCSTVTQGGTIHVMPY